MALRSSPSSFQLLAKLVLFALVISPVFAVTDLQIQGENEKHHPDVITAETHIDEGRHTGEASPSLEDEKILSGYRTGAYGPSYGIGGYGGMGMGMGRRSYGYGIYRHGGYSRLGCRRASTCICHCLNGMAASSSAASSSAQKTQGTTNHP